MKTEDLISADLIALIEKALILQRDLNTFIHSDEMRNTLKGYASDELIGLSNSLCSGISDLGDVMGCYASIKIEEYVSVK